MGFHIMSDSKITFDNVLSFLSTQTPEQVAASVAELDTQIAGLQKTRAILLSISKRAIGAAAGTGGAATKTTALSGARVALDDDEAVEALLKALKASGEDGASGKALADVVGIPAQRATNLLKGLGRKVKQRGERRASRWFLPTPKK